MKVDSEIGEVIVAADSINWTTIRGPSVGTATVGI